MSGPCDDYRPDVGDVLRDPITGRCTRIVQIEPFFAVEPLSDEEAQRYSGVTETNNAD